MKRTITKSNGVVELHFFMLGGHVVKLISSENVSLTFSEKESKLRYIDAPNYNDSLVWIDVDSVVAVIKHVGVIYDDR